MTNDAMAVPAWTKTLLRQALEYEAREGRVYAELMAAIAPAAPSQHHAVSQFVATTHEFACVVLRSQADYPAHVVDFATGILSEALAFVQAERSRANNLRLHNV
jgi:hypothetical protein